MTTSSFLRLPLLVLILVGAAGVQTWVERWLRRKRGRLDDGKP